MDNRNRYRQGGGGGAPTAPTLTISNIVFKSVEQTLQATVTATRGDKVATGINVQWFLDGNPVGEQVTTDGNGRAKIFIKDQVLTPREYSLQVRAMSFNVMAQETFPVPKPGEVQPDSPVIEVIGSSIQVKKGYQLSLSITARKGSQPITNVPVDISWLDKREMRFLDVTGKASAVINIPIPTKQKMLVEVRCFIEEPPVEAQKVFELEWKTRMPKRATVSNPWKVKPGEYRVRVVVEDDEGVVPGAMISVTGGKESEPKLTNENGIAEIDLICLEDEEYTNFVIDIIPGIEKVKIDRLAGKKAKVTEKPKEEKRLKKDANILEHFLQGVRVGSGKSVLKKSRR